MSGGLSGLVLHRTAKASCQSLCLCISCLYRKASLGWLRPSTVGSYSLHRRSIRPCDNTCSLAFPKRCIELRDVGYCFSSESQGRRMRAWYGHMVPVRESPRASTAISFSRGRRSTLGYSFHASPIFIVLD